MMVLEEGCPLYEGGKPVLQAARERVMEEFGPAALINPPNPKREEDMAEMVATHKLRKLATSLGLVEPSSQSYLVKREQLLEMLKEQFPEIESLSEQEIEEITVAAKSEQAPAEPAAKAAAPKGQDEKKAGAPAGGRKVVRKPVTEPKTPDEGTKAVEKKPDEKAQGGEQGAAPARRPATVKRTPALPGGKPAAQVEGQGQDPPGITQRVDAIGTEMDKANGKLDMARKELSEVNNKLTAVVGCLTFLYNSAVDDDSQVTSILELDWD